MVLTQVTNHEEADIHLVLHPGYASTQGFTRLVYTKDTDVVVGDNTVSVFCVDHQACEALSKHVFGCKARCVNFLMVTWINTIFKWVNFIIATAACNVWRQLQPRMDRIWFRKTVLAQGNTKNLWRLATGRSEL